jgi:hypothetical protein
MTIQSVLPQNLTYQTQPENNDILNQAIKKVMQVAIGTFQKIESYALPVLTKLTTRGIAESIMSGAFGGAITGLLFFALGLPKDNTGITILSFCVSGEFSKLYQNARIEASLKSEQTEALSSEETSIMEISNQKSV